MIMKYTGKVVLDYRRGVEEEYNGLGSFQPVKDHYESYRSYDEICINDYRGPESSQLIPSYIDYSTENKISILSTDAQFGSEKSQRWLNTQDWSHGDTKSNKFSGKGLKVVKELTEHQLLLLHPATPVYGLKLKQWSKSSSSFGIWSRLKASSVDINGLYSRDCSIVGKYCKFDYWRRRAADNPCAVKQTEQHR